MFLQNYQMNKNLTPEISFLFILMVYAIIVTHGYTIVWGLFPLFFGFLGVVSKPKLPTLKSVLLVLGLFGLIFLLNFLAVYNFKNHKLEFPHPDFHFYLKIASFFNQTGIENNLTAKTVLFHQLDYATPYRFFDTWLLSFLIALVPLSNLEVLQLVYLPVLFFLVSFSLYRNLDFVKNDFFKLVLAISFLFLFGDYYIQHYIFHDTTSEVCMVSYPKLAIFFCCFIYFIRGQFSKEHKQQSVFFLALLPILIQTSFPIYLVVYGYILRHYKYFLQNKRIVVLILISTFYYALFYIYNGYLSTQYFQLGPFQFVKSASEYFYRLASISFNVVKDRLLIFLLLVGVLLLFSKSQRRRQYLELIFIAFAIIFSGIVFYAFLPASPNSYQLMSNFIFPLFISTIFFIWIDYLMLQKRLGIIINTSIFSILVFLGIYNQYTATSFFNVKDSFCAKNDKNFVLKSEQLLKELNNKIGITYWSDKNPERNFSEYFDQYGTNFLIKMGGNYDVVCLSSLQSKPISYADSVSQHSSAIALFERLHKIKSKKDIENIFYSNNDFQFLISDLPKDNLPQFLKEDCSQFVFDPTSKVYLYTLKKH
jgi:hypothetical protein